MSVVPVSVLLNKMVEDTHVSEIAIDIWPGIFKYMKKVSSGPKAKYSP